MSKNSGLFIVGAIAGLGAILFRSHLRRGSALSALKPAASYGNGAMTTARVREARRRKSPHQRLRL